MAPMKMRVVIIANTRRIAITMPVEGGREGGRGERKRGREGGREVKREREGGRIMREVGRVQ